MIESPSEVPPVSPPSLGFAAKVATTCVSPPTVTRHGPVPEQPPPDQPVKSEWGDGFAVRVIISPSSNNVRNTGVLDYRSISCSPKAGRGERRSGLPRPDRPPDSGRYLAATL